VRSLPRVVCAPYLPANRAGGKRVRQIAYRDHRLSKTIRVAG